ncbi:MAG: hypothetical protein HY564_00885, partial [Candidatus Jacksonbacteria bacterium]|nr:hypothetical protein [Candidatus Jacksonbacteria bacterium]
MKNFRSRRAAMEHSVCGIILGAATAVFFLAVSFASAQAPNITSFTCTISTTPVGPGHACGALTTGAVEVQCNSPYVCSSNEFNTCKTRVCLAGVGGECASDKDCEGGSICNPTTKRCDISPDDDTASSSDLRDTIRRILNVILGFLGIITVVMVIYGGFVWLTAAGNDDAVAKGRHTLLWA